MSRRQISLSNLANAFILLKVRLARVDFVHQGFERKNCLTFANGRLLAFTKVRTDP